ncbi:hypothetical protein BDN70DRAFT_930443 [Pholiota conissans]|uniref:Uncharacterized protein n=1 Tax=Pholiota conissans TaxID=109636 RepID=A0A9P5Z6G7_9AGAR|nr:hypothetical protein BDN70DRAFT_930443 [Pholiota conissans]
MSIVDVDFGGRKERRKRRFGNGGGLQPFPCVVPLLPLLALNDVSHIMPLFPRSDQAQQAHVPRVLDVRVNGERCRGVALWFRTGTSPLTVPAWLIRSIEVRTRAMFRRLLSVSLSPAPPLPPKFCLHLCSAVSPLARSLSLCIPTHIHIHIFCHALQVVL